MVMMKKGGYNRLRGEGRGVYHFEMTEQAAWRSRCHWQFLRQGTTTREHERGAIPVPNLISTRML